MGIYNTTGQRAAKWYKPTRQHKYLRHFHSIIPTTNSKTIGYGRWFLFCQDGNVGGNHRLRYGTQAQNGSTGSNNTLEKCRKVRYNTVDKGVRAMGITKTKKNSVVPYAVLGALFALACVLQQVDDLVGDWKASKLLALTAQYIFLGILAYWTVSVVNRVSDKEIRIGLATTIILMSLLLILKLVKYNVVYEKTAERYLWYAYYIPQCLAPAVLLYTVIGMAQTSHKAVLKCRKWLFVPAILLILLVFTNDIHQQVFSFSQGLQHANEEYEWQWGYYVILAWIAGLYLTDGVLLFVKCRVSHCRKKAWIPLALFVGCLACCILREVFNPLFIKMPETVVFSVVVVSESLIVIGFIPSNTQYAMFFDAADVSAVIADSNLEVELSSKNAPQVTREQALAAFTDGEIALSRDITLKAKAITGGEVFWTEDSSVINKINDRLTEINATLAEEIDIISAENRLKEQRSKIEQQNNLYKNIFDIAKPHLKKIGKGFADAVTVAQKDEALRFAVVQGVFLKRRSNLKLSNVKGKISLTELVYALRESADALTFYDVHSSVFMSGDGEFAAEQIELVYQFFEDCVECALPDLAACLVRLSATNGVLSCRIALDNVKNVLSASWRKTDRERLGATLRVEESDETMYATLTFAGKEVTL